MRECGGCHQVLADDEFPVLSGRQTRRCSACRAAQALRESQRTPRPPEVDPHAPVHLLGRAAPGRRLYDPPDEIELACYTQVWDAGRWSHASS
jgi:hypothetical protein